jgi:hypothetical protein
VLPIPSELNVQANPLGCLRGFVQRSQRNNQLFACLELFSAWSQYALVAAKHQLSNDIAPKSFRGLAELPTSRRRRSAWICGGRFRVNADGCNYPLE